MSRRPKVWDKLPKVGVYKPNLDAFYKFMYERHMIWHRRFALRQPPPWTGDPILRDYKFTNVYRELDRGTIWYVEHVVPSSTMYDVAIIELLWLTVMYRLLNRVETFEKVGFVLHSDWYERRGEWKKKLRNLHKTESIFTNAHLTLPTHQIGSTKIDKYFEVLDYLRENLARLAGDIWHGPCRSLEDVFETLKEIPCVGDFISYEVCCDFILVKAVPYSENDWANAGPGAKGGIKLIFPLSETKEDFYDRMVQLANEQEKHFKRLGLNFPYLYEGKTLTLRSIEHSLCEFRKYKNVQAGMGKPRMKYVPRDGSSSQGQNVLRFPREE